MDIRIMRWIKRITKWISVTITVLLGLVVVAYVGLLFVNRSDEPPSTAATAFAKMVKNSPSPDSNDNAMLYYAGINVPQGEDPLVQGKAWLKWSRLPVKKQWTTDEPRGKSLSTQLKSDKTPQLSTLIQHCHTPTPECLSDLQSQPLILRGNLNKVQWILDRYERLLRYTIWHDSNANSPLAILMYLDASTLNKLYSVHIWQLAQNGKTKQAMEALDREARFWRMVLDNNRTLIGKMISYRLLDNNLRWTNTILRQASTGLKYAVPESWRKSITLQERSLQPALANELLFAKNVLEQKDDMLGEISAMDRFWNKLGAPLVKTQATLNLIASNYVRINQALNVTYKELPDSLNSLRQRQENELNKNMYQAYNPYGYMLYRMGVSMELRNFGLRVADLEGKRRLLVLAATLRSKGVAAKDVPSHLKSSAIKNPYTGKAFGWDAETESLTFNELGSKTEALYLLRY